MKIVGFRLSNQEMMDVKGGYEYVCTCVGGTNPGQEFVNSWSSWEDEAEFKETGRVACGGAEGSSPGSEWSFNCSHVPY